MITIAQKSGTRSIVIAGCGIRLEQPYELASGIVITPEVPVLSPDVVAKSCRNFADYIAVISGQKIQSFAIEIHPSLDSPDELTAKAWNALWDFHLLSVATHTPCFSLYSYAVGAEPILTAANRTIVFRPIESLKLVSESSLTWASKHREKFDKLIGNSLFSRAMRCYGNAQQFIDFDTRIMLLWSGIEGLLSVDGELNRRLALYTALLMDGSHTEKMQWFNDVKKAYGIRSKAVHGSSLDAKLLQEGYLQAARILSNLLARCVELGRIPSPTELDAQAVAGNLE